MTLSTITTHAMQNIISLQEEGEMILATLVFRTFNYLSNNNNEPLARMFDNNHRSCNWSDNITCECYCRPVNRR